MNRTLATVGSVLLVASCSREPHGSKLRPSESQAQPRSVTPRAEPTIDPKSSEAAENLVLSFIRLLNEGRYADAYMLLGPHASRRADFERQWSSYSDLRVTSGAAGPQDGAAGSIYVSVPLTISGKLDGDRVSRSATAVLRRVNDVPGSTEAQRRWHIERIELAK